MTNGVENRPHDKSKNRPDIINPVPLMGVVGEHGLKALLVRKKQTAWCTRVRILGLLLLIDYICRHLKRGQISMSADLAHQFVSKLRNTCFGTMITEPLLAVCEIGILETVRPAVFAHVKASAVYRFAFSYRQQLRLEVVLTPKLAQKTRMRFRPPRATTEAQIPMAREAIGGLARDQLL
jgi:hypothetical protein